MEWHPLSRIRDRLVACVLNWIRHCSPNRVHPTAMRRALELVTGENVTNFKAQNSKAIVEHLCPVLWGNVYDYSAGYGGRLLGISCSNMNYNYTGIDPNTETVKYLNLSLIHI